MIQKQMEAWKKFLRGRIAQEQGREEESLRAFEAALQVDTENPLFNDARAVALCNLDRKLSRVEEDRLMHVQQSYEHLAGAASGDNVGRAEGLKEMLAELEGNPVGRHVRKYVRGLHS